MPEQVEETEQAYDSRLTITGRTITTIGCVGSLTAAFYYFVVPLAGAYLIAQIGAWNVIVAGMDLAYLALQPRLPSTLSWPSSASCLIGLPLASAFRQ